MSYRSLPRPARAAILAAGILGGLVLLYALAGAVLLPWLVKRELPAFAQEKWNARARVGEVEFNPFTLRLRAAGLALEEKSGKPLLALREAVADLEWRSLARRGVVLSELKLAEPVVRVEISEKGRLNFASLAVGPAGKKDEGGLPAIELGALTVENGRVDFEDKSQGYANRFEQLSLKLTSVSTMKGDKGPYDLAAQTPDGGKLRWKGEVSVSPPALSGTLVVEHGTLAQLNPYLDDHSDARIRSGRARVELPHRLALVSGEPQVEISKARLAIEDLALITAGTDRPFVTVAQLALDGVDADLRARRVSAQALRVAGYTAAARRDASGEVQPRLRLVKEVREEAKKAEWHVAVAQVDLSGGSVSLADEGAGIAIALERVSARAGSVSSDAAQPVAFEIGADLAGGGKLALRGKAVRSTDTLEARVEASGVPASLFQGLIARHADIRIQSGQVALAGDLATGAETKTRRGKSARLLYSGSAALENVAVRDASGAPLAEWKSLHTKALRLSVAPNMARIDELRWTAPRARLEIARDGTTNLGRLFRGAGQPGAQPAKESKPPPAAAKDGRPQPAPGAGSDDPDEAGDFPVRIRRVQVEKGTLDFSDHSLSPNFSAVIQDLAGAVNGLSTDRNTRSQIALEGRVNEFGYARISGTLNAFAPRERTSFRVQFRNLDMASVSPYTIKFAGYRVASGRMSLDLNYQVRESRLEGDNHIVLDDFVLGERVGEGASPGLPLELAVSLLKDANGRIDIGVPISGSLEDPEFKLGDVFWKAFGTIIGNIIAAPFRALARVFGGGAEELAVIAFEPGESRLLPPEREKFKRIAEGLAKRPELKVVIPARYDAEADARAIRREGLRRELAKRAGFEVSAEDPAGPLSIEDRRTRRALRELYAQRFGEDELARQKAEAEREAGGAKDLGVGERIRNFAAGEPQVANPAPFYRALYRRLLDAEAVSEGALAGLAQKRAAAIAAELQAAGVDAGRMTQSTAEPTSNADARQVTIQLSLAAG